MDKSNSQKHLLVIENQSNQRTVNLQSATCSIGRDEKNLIVLDSVKISRYHATLLRITTPGVDSHQFRIIDGDLNGRRSRNGIKVNGQSCFSYDLQDEDVITFCEGIIATYHAANSPIPPQSSESFFDLQEEDDPNATRFLGDSNSSHKSTSRQTHTISEEERQASIQQSLERLASFPELFSDPIIEIDLKGNITYLNPAALKTFPALKKDKVKHPILAGVIALVEAKNETSIVREVIIKNRIFEQSIHLILISASQLVRCYVSDITKRKQAEIILRQAHKKLETRVEQRTAELAYNNRVLQQEIADRKQVEQEISLLQTITQAITEARDFDDAIAIILRKVCETVGWSFAEAWIPDKKANLLKISPSWYCSRSELKCFREESEAFAFPYNVGKPGRVWATKQPKWTEDVCKLDGAAFLRKKIAQAVGLKAALGVPMIANDEVIAVFVFFDSSVHAENSQMVDLVASVAAQLGLMIERKRADDALRSSMATNRAILNAIPDLIFRIDRKGIFVNFKAAKEKNLLTPEKEFLGKHVNDVFPQDIASSILNCLEKAFVTGEVQLLECQITQKNKVHSYEVRFAVSDVAEVMAIVRDITERKQAEEDIRRTLEQEKKLNELKSRFVTMASHEFRTPLASILSSSELLEHYSHKWGEDKKIRHLYRIQSSVKHMTDLLNDVLLLGKADAGKLELKPTKINLVQFCQDIVEEIGLNSETHQIIFQTTRHLEVTNDPEQKSLNTINECCPEVYLDEKILRHILYNLLSNAIKYSPDADRVLFDLICQPNQAIFRIQDFGIGIPLKDQEQLFDSFHRADNVGSIPGTGLGLPIVKRSVDLHSGTIMMTSQIEQGSTFTVTLPSLNP